jgi:hypothetical protein
MSARNTPESTPRLVAAKPAALALGIPYTSLRDIVFRGEIPVIRIGRAWYLERGDIEKWIANRKGAAYGC